MTAPPAPRVPRPLGPSPTTLLAPREHTQPGRRLHPTELGVPGRGPGVGMHDRVMDDVAIRRVVAGRAKLSTLTYAERREAIARLRAMRMTPEAIVPHVGSTDPVVRAWVRWVEHGVWCAPNTPRAEVEAALTAHEQAQRHA